MAISARKSASCSQKAIFVYNLTAAVLVVTGVGLLAFPDVDGSVAAGERRWIDLTLAAIGVVVMAGGLAAAILRTSDEDEYVRRLAGQSTMIGFYAATFAFVVWRPLANSWVALPTGDQILGILFIGTGVGYVASRWLGVR